MPRRTTIALVTAAAVLAAPGQASAQTPAPPVTEPPTTKYFFTCDGPSKVQNPTLVTGERSWSTERPTASFTSGAGCGWFDSPLTGTGPETVYDAVFGGRHGGAFIAAKVELHNLVLGRATEAAFVPTLFVRLTVDGDEVVPERQIEVTPVLSANGISQSVTFELKNLKVPAGAADRPVVLTVDSIGSAWVMGAAEVPAGMELTPPPPPKTT